MKPVAAFRRTLLLCGLMLTVGLPWHALAAEEEEPFSLKGKWGVGLRAGPAIPTHDLVDNISPPIEADAAIDVSGNILYAMTDYLNLGLLLEYENYKFDLSDVDVGRMNTFSLMPFFELRHIIQSSVAIVVPYIFMGGGVSFNSV